jgi:membrane-associated phospholipid phosphatase
LLFWFALLQCVSAIDSSAHRLEARSWFFTDAALVVGIIALAAVQSRISECAPVTAWRSGARCWFAIFRQGFAIFLVLPLAYTQAGSFGTTLVPSVEHWFIAADRLLFHVNWYTRRPPLPGFASTLFESAYLANYGLLFLGFLLAVSLRNGGNRIGPRRSFGEWLTNISDPVVLNSVCGSLVGGLLLCYAFFPLLPAVTPRLYFSWLSHPVESAVHDVNWYLLSQFSIPWGILPSGHVAGPVAIGCALAARRRRLWALFFLASALTIAIATVYGNYHFVSDAVAGWLAGMAAWALVERTVMRRAVSRQTAEATAESAAEAEEALRAA